jgi:hypothetical protein
MLPQHLYDQSSFATITEALQSLAKVKAAAAAAKTAHDRSEVESLWDND